MKKTTTVLRTAPARTTTTAVEIVIPVHNEAHILEASSRLYLYLSERFPLSWRITIVDNASTDATWAVAQTLLAASPGSGPSTSTGRAAAAPGGRWLASDARIVAYMDVDLSTDLGALLPLVAPLVSGHSDVAIGSRLAPSSRVARAPKRELISRSYNLILRTVFGTHVRDAQCGFKAVRSDVAQRLLPDVVDDAWFFDTELLLLAERNGLRIHEVPVDWVDDPDSRVDVRRTGADDLRGVWRVARTFRAGRGYVDLGGSARPPSPTTWVASSCRSASSARSSTAVSLVLFVLLAPRSAWPVHRRRAARCDRVRQHRGEPALSPSPCAGVPVAARHYAAGTALGLLPLVLTLSRAGRALGDRRDVAAGAPGHAHRRQRAGDRRPLRVAAPLGVRAVNRLGNGCATGSSRSSPPSPA